MAQLSPRVVGSLACFMNFGILVFNLGFTNADGLAALNPGAFSPFGQFMILVWGLLVFLVGQNDNNVPSPIWLGFAVERSCYVYAWVSWHMKWPAG